MNKELFELSLQSLRRKKRSSLLLFAVLFLSFAFAIVSLTVTGSIQKTNQEYRYDVYGEWYGAIYKEQDGDEEFLRERDWLRELSATHSCGTIQIDTSSGSGAGIGPVNDDFLKMGRIGLQDGRFPETAGEIAMEADLLSALGYDYTLGREITFTVSIPVTETVREGNADELTYTPDAVTAEVTFTLCGVLREYTDLWVRFGSGTIPLNSALLTSEGVEVLRQEGDLAAKAVRDSLNARRRKTGVGGEVLGINLDPLTTQYFFSVLPGKEKVAEEQVGNYLRANREIVGNAWKLTVNTPVFSGEEEAVEGFYTWLILAVTLLAVVCIYTIRMQDEARQLAVFRSIGITKRQLCVMLLYETLLLGVPALILGEGAGAFGTWAFLRLAVYSGSAAVYLAISPALLAVTAVLWILSVLIARLAIFLVALRAPLTGRFYMARKKAKRYTNLRRVLIAGLSVLLCTALIFTVVESIQPLEMIRYLDSTFDYVISKDSNIEFNYSQPFPQLNGKTLVYNVGYLYQDATLPTELAVPVSQIPGVEHVYGWGQQDVRLEFDGIEDAVLLQTSVENYHRINRENLDSAMFADVNILPYGIGLYDPDAAFVKLLMVDEGDWEGIIDFDVIDREKFRSGEEVLMSFSMNDNGKFEPLYRNIFTGKEFEETGIDKGDTVRITIGSASKQGTVEAEVGGIITYPYGLLCGELEALEEQYTIICSGAFVDKLLDSLGENEAWNIYRQGTPYGYRQMFIYADKSADYLSTDMALAEFCADENLYLNVAVRALNQSNSQQYIQKLILVLSGGFCVTLVLLLILWNTLAMEAERQKRNIGIQQALGMSRKQLRLQQLKTAAIRGGPGILLGWLAYGGYWTFLHLSDESSRGGSFTITNEWLYKQEINIMRKLSSADWNWTNWPVILLLTALCIGLVLGVSWLANRRLTKEDLMAKLRDEH